jgi:phosphoribosyl-ATP pyrophosphohydrolase/phosphoribosyl-AMP cyclohydrolase/histidinol dehydrogenase
VNHLLPERTVAEILGTRADILDDDTLRVARTIIARVRQGGIEPMLAVARELGDWDGAQPWWFDRERCIAALKDLPAGARADLESMAHRVRAFANHQRGCYADLTTEVPGGRAGHTFVPVTRVGCYAPAGRFPLPSSVLMTVIPARVAGVDDVWVATPRPGPMMLAAAAVAGADGVLGIGGAQAIAALAEGVGPVPRCDAIVGPGNRFVTAAKQLYAGRVTIDSLAGPSELVVVADASADPEIIAADLIAQAEHDVDALAVLITPSRSLADLVRASALRQVEGLPTGAVASTALERGAVIRVPDLDGALEVIDALAPEHLQVMLPDAAAFARRVRHAGALFVGAHSAEVFGDYGAGPNHVLPTGGAARGTAGLGVGTFLRPRTWLEIDDPGPLSGAIARLARLEGLEGHARAAERRKPRDA